MQHLLPTGADTTPPTIVGYKYPTNLSTATPRDPVELELTAFDERGDMDRVDLYADGALHSSVPVYPFQFRYTPPTSKIGSVVKLTAEAFDKAGNKSTRDLYVNVIAGTTAPASPVAVAPPSLLGTPVVGEQLACINGGFTNQPTSLTYAWLRNGAVIAGADVADLHADGRRPRPLGGVPDHGDQRRGLRRRDLRGRDRVQPGPGAGVHRDSRSGHDRGSDDDHVTKTTTAKTTTVKYVPTCTVARSKKAISCTVSVTPKSTVFTGTIRLQGVKQTAKSTKSKTGKVKLTVRSSKTLKKGQKVVLTLKSGKTTKVITAKTR